MGTGISNVADNLNPPSPPGKLSLLVHLLRVVDFPEQHTQLSQLRLEHSSRSSPLPLDNCTLPSSRIHHFFYDRSPLCKYPPPSIDIAVIGHIPTSIGAHINSQVSLTALSTCMNSPPSERRNSIFRPRALTRHWQYLYTLPIHTIIHKNA